MVACCFHPQGLNSIKSLNLPESGEEPWDRSVDLAHNSVDWGEVSRQVLSVAIIVLAVAGVACVIVIVVVVVDDVIPIAAEDVDVVVVFAVVVSFNTANTVAIVVLLW